VAISAIALLATKYRPVLTFLLEINLINELTAIDIVCIQCIALLSHYALWHNSVVSKYIITAQILLF